ncbi:MAG TPA: thymidine phosphorylase [Candidatus Nanoarchaeia archaeon]|nr:thymidine phosphorylase [Candidatus Nanoarchaeia archaeon]
MKLKAKVLRIATKGPFVAILNEFTAELLNVEVLDRILIKKGLKKLVVAVDFALGESSISKKEIGIFLDVAEAIHIKDGDFVNVKLVPKPASLNLIKKKLDKHELTESEVNIIIKDIIDNRLTEVETTYFISACYVNGLSMSETAYLTKAVSNNGGKLKFDAKYVLDKHCLGGLGANRTTMIITPIIAAAGFLMPKTSTRSITSPAGTSDTMEVLAPVAHSKKEIMRIVKKTNACMVWGGTIDLASADDKLIRLERPLSLDPEGIMLASILAKKSAANSTHILIDIPIGPETKIKDKEVAKNLARKFISFGKNFGMKVKVIITDGSQPVGNGIGPALEARDVLSALEGNGPRDLRDKSLYMAALMLDMVGVKDSYKKVLEIIDSGTALRKMKEIIKAQGGNPNVKSKDIELGKYSFIFKSKKSGNVSYISNNLVCRIAKIAGAPFDKCAGVYLHEKVNDKVKKNSPLFTIYAESREKLGYAKSLDLNKVYIIG